MERKTDGAICNNELVKEGSAESNSIKVDDNGKEAADLSESKNAIADDSRNDVGNSGSVASGSRTSFYRRNNNNNFTYNGRNNSRQFYNRNHSNRSDDSTGGNSENFRYNRFRRRRKICEFCADKLDFIDYKDTTRLSKFLTDRAKIVTRRSAGTCARHQRALSTALKRARYMALLPYCNK